MISPIAKGLGRFSIFSEKNITVQYPYLKLAVVRVVFIDSSMILIFLTNLFYL